LDTAARGDELSGSDFVGARGLEDDEEGGAAVFALDEAGPEGDDDGGPDCFWKKPSRVDCFLPADEVGGAGAMARVGQMDG
jgi:hypothetical protein